MARLKVSVSGLAPLVGDVGRDTLDDTLSDDVLEAGAGVRRKDPTRSTAATS